MDINYDELLSACGGMISIADAKLLDQTASEIESRYILEIGAWEGCSTVILHEIAKQNHGILYTIEPKVRRKFIENRKRWNIDGHNILVRGFSPWIDPTLVEKIKESGIDYLLIDGNHLTRWILTDYHFWSPFVRVGGRIAIHDWTGAKGVGEGTARSCNHSGN